MAVAADAPARPLLLSAVLGCLSQREVAACSSVCRVWRSAVERLRGGCAVGWLYADLQGSARPASLLARWPVAALRQVGRLSLLFCKRLGDAELRRLLRLLPHLTDVDLGGCHALTDAALLSLAHVHDDDGEEAEEAAAAAPQRRPRALQRLSLYWCPQLSDQVELHTAAVILAAAEGTWGAFSKLTGSTASSSCAAMCRVCPD